LEEQVVFSVETIENIAAEEPVCKENLKSSCELVLCLKTKRMRYAEGEKDATLQHYDLEPAIFELPRPLYEIHLRTLPFRK